MDEQEFDSELVIELVERIEYNFNNIPDKRKKQYQEWKVIQNKLIKKCNKLSGIAMYAIIK